MGAEYRIELKAPFECLFAILAEVQNLSEVLRLFEEKENLNLKTNNCCKIPILETS